MAAESAKLRFASMNRSDQKEVRAIVQALLDGVQMLAAKLDADATVTDTNYAALFAAIVTD